jgi:hypothetical protein
MRLELRLSPRALAPLLASLALLAASSRAGAQTVSDADRAAARELATQGLQLQQAGNFADALDRFDRAQAVFSAPTHLLHIAECEAALGKLVESAETYRTLVRTPLPAGAPAAFVQAQQEGAAELSQVEPRIPSVKIVIRPRVIPNSVIQIDGQAMSSALVGVDRPTDPGPHTIVLVAPGYARAEQRIVLKEKETKEVAFNLGAAAPGGFYIPPPASTQTSPSYPPPQTYPPQQSQQPQQYTPPASFTVPGDVPPPEHEPARGGFMLGASLGGLVPVGNASQGSSLGNLASAGPAIQINGGFRFVRRLYMGLTYEHGFLSAGSGIGTTSDGSGATADSNYIGFDFAYISNPDGVGFFGKLGVGYRILDLSGTLTDVNGSPAQSESLNGAEFWIGAGVHIALGKWVRLIPNASLNIGQFSSSSVGSISNTDTHEFILIGVTALVDFSRKH